MRARSIQSNIEIYKQAVFVFSSIASQNVIQNERTVRDFQNGVAMKLCDAKF